MRMDEKDRIIEELRTLVAEQAARLRELEARIAELQLELARAKKDSSTSSKPPSSDIVKPRPEPAKQSRKKPRAGGQPGHPQLLREPLPAERVDQTIFHQIDDDQVRRLNLVPTGEFDVVQHIELPETPVCVTEHRLTVYRDPSGHLHVPDVPELKGPIFGPRLLATIGWLKSVGHLSYSSIEEWMEDVLEVPVSRGYLAKLCTRTISGALDSAYQEVQEAIPQQDQLGSDETSIKNNGIKHWIWCITATPFSFFQIAKSRSRAVLEELVGAEFAGYLNFDYFSANCSFAWNYEIQAQYCWAHLIRDMRFLLKHPDPATQDWAEQLLERSRRLFSAWHRREQMTAEGFRRSMLTHRDRFLRVVRDPPGSREAQNLAVRFAEVDYRVEGTDELRQYDQSQDYFRFLFVEGLEPTNNHTEQQIRHCVIDRKITQGTRSEVGQRYLERVWTAIATCRKQARSFFSFLCESIAAKLDNRPAPSLIHG